MRLLPSRGRHRRYGDWPDDDQAARELAESQARLERDREDVVEPLLRMRDRNNVSALVTRLVRQGEGRHGRPAPS